MKISIREENLIKKTVQKKILASLDVINMLTIKKEVKNNRFTLR